MAPASQRCGPSTLQWVTLFLSWAPVVDAGSVEGPWFEHDYEENLVEVSILFVLVIIALMFETSWRNIAEKAHRSYRYGMIHDSMFGSSTSSRRDSHGNMRHHILSKELSIRAGAEFMILGFLAFLVFFFNQINGFSLFLELVPASEKWHMPRDSTEWLHMVERVLMQLFVGMVMYFVLMLQIIGGSLTKIQEWERARIQELNGKQESPESGEEKKKNDPEANYHTMKGYFLSKIPAWREKRPALFKQVLELFGLEHANEAVLLQLPDIVDNRFAFSAYLSLNIESGVLDSIEVQPLTWFCVMADLLFLGLGHRILGLTLTHLSYVLTFVVFGVLYAMHRIVDHRQTRIDEKTQRLRGLVLDSRKEDGFERDPIRRFTSKITKTKNKKGALNVFQRLNMELCVMRLLQTIMILNSYSFASRLGNVTGWNTKPGQVVAICVFLGLAFGMQCYFLPKLVPNFLALTSLPPFDNEDNMTHFFATLVDDHSPLSYKTTDPREDISAKLRRAATKMIAESKGAPDLDALIAAERGDDLPEAREAAHLWQPSTFFGTDPLSAQEIGRAEEEW